MRENWGLFIDGLSPLFVGCKFGGNPFSPIIFDAVFGGMRRRCLLKCLYEELLSEVMHTIHLE